jgi:hypothetical protein
MKMESRIQKPKASNLVALWFILLAASFSLRAQSYSIDWFKVAGGGGTSANGQFLLSGTIGQHDAGGPMTNGQYSVTGGFWVLPQAIQVTGAPTLTITPASPGTATISWAPNTSGFVLQETWSLSLVNWTNSASGSANPATVSTVNAARFYRHSKP